MRTWGRPEFQPFVSQLVIWGWFSEGSGQQFRAQVCQVKGNACKIAIQFESVDRCFPCSLSDIPVFLSFLVGAKTRSSCPTAGPEGCSDLPLPLPGVAVAGSGKREKGSLSWSAKGTVTVGAAQRSGSRGRHVSTGRDQDLERCQEGGQWG